MQLINGMELFHGSHALVDDPGLSRCSRFRDFGRGFYLTTDYDQACSFVRLSARKAAQKHASDMQFDRGFVSRFLVDDGSLYELRFLGFDEANEEWLQCIVAHRRRRTFAEIVQQLSGYDVIAGKIANDRTNITLALYMDGIYGTVGSTEAAKACISQLIPERLKDQYCFRTEKALSCLRFEGVDVVWM